MTRWEYETEIVGPGDDWRRTLELRGERGWEAYFIHLIRDGGREIYFKRPVYPSGASTTQ